MLLCIAAMLPFYLCMFMFDYCENGGKEKSGNFVLHPQLFWAFLILWFNLWLVNENTEEKERKEKRRNFLVLTHYCFGL